MSDLAATNCGCPREEGGCNSIIWIILLLCCCGNGGGGLFGGGGSCGGGNDCCWIIILLLLCGGNFCGGGMCYFSFFRKGALSGSLFSSHQLLLPISSSLAFFRISCRSIASLILHSGLIFFFFRHSSSTSYTLFPSIISPIFRSPFSFAIRYAWGQDVSHRIKQKA